MGRWAGNWTDTNGLIATFMDDDTMAKTAKTAKKKPAPKAPAKGRSSKAKPSKGGAEGMGKKLVVVESPAKAKTINRYLGSDYIVKASYGHVRDLNPKEEAVETEHYFERKYQMIDRNSKHVDAIVKEMKKSDALYLATDPDREGEAISWHLIELLKERGALNGKPVHRVVFHESTKAAVQEAIDNPREL